jgi:hypothetical protein
MSVAGATRDSPSHQSSYDWSANGFAASNDSSLLQQRRMIQ